MARTQKDRDEDLALGRELERKDAEIDRLRRIIRCERETGTCVMLHDPERPPCTVVNCNTMLKESERR